MSCGITHDCRGVSGLREALRSEKSRADNLAIVCEHHKTAAAEHEANEDALAKELAEAKADQLFCAGKKLSPQALFEMADRNGKNALEELHRRQQAEAEVKRLHFELKRHVEGHVICMEQRDKAQAEAGQLREELRVLKNLHEC